MTKMKSYIANTIIINQIPIAPTAKTQKQPESPEPHIRRQLLKKSRMNTNNN
jgi:hypothetical protein